jgi:hypothetical protein
MKEERLDLWLSERWLMDSDCGVCGERGWTIGDDLQLHLADHPNRVHDFMPVTCTTCGQTLFFHRA